MTKHFCDCCGADKGKDDLAHLFNYYVNPNYLGLLASTGNPWSADLCLDCYELVTNIATKAKRGVKP